ncbi:uncharacterized protein LOC134235321 [Saccostrea cucullata]|uniref:uncharacterized protein LOC134235321 n=1 Tax=Saccostrea cuccullata TaxID=36930 RepID=UPI002ED0D7A9
MMFSSLMDGMDHHISLRNGLSLFSPPPSASTTQRHGPVGTRLGDLEIFSPPSITPTLSPFTSPIPPVPLSPFLMSPPSQMPPAESHHHHAYLKRLQKNPMFRDLQNLLAQECLHMQVPTNLIDSSQNNTTVKSEHCDVFPRHMKLQEKFLELRAIESLRSEGLNLESTYSGEVGQIEVSRYQALCAAGISDQHRKAVNHHHDVKRLDLIQQYEVILQQVQHKKNLPHVTSNNVISKPLLTTDKGVVSMAFPHKSSGQVARQLAFAAGKQNDSCVKRPDTPDSIPEVVSSPECLEVDLSREIVTDEETDLSFFRTKTMLGDSGICEDDASSCVSDGSDHHSDAGKCSEDSKLSAIIQSKKNCVLQPFDINTHTHIFNGGNIFKRSTDFVKEDYRSEETNQSIASDNSITMETVTVGRHSLKRKLCPEPNDENIESKQPRMSEKPQGKKITADSTRILSAWYDEHIRYPYPSDLEVEQLAKQTGLTQQQIKKWMANKRVRNYNTLSITGNQHPIKFKFKGQRYSDNGTDGKPNNYKQLHPEARRILSEWYEANRENPYPSDEVKSELAKRTGISEQQVKSWFANKRSRANNTRKQVPNYFIKKFPEFTSHVQMVSLTRELARKSKRSDCMDSVLQCAYRN